MAAIFTPKDGPGMLPDDEIDTLLTLIDNAIDLATEGQLAVDEKSNEFPAAKQLLAGLLLEGRVITMDALLPAFCEPPLGPPAKGGLQGRFGARSGPAHIHER
jgi:hypothetical protein